MKYSELSPANKQKFESAVGFGALGGAVLGGTIAYLLGGKMMAISIVGGLVAGAAGGYFLGQPKTD